jgi:hypothetical protein
VLQQGGKGGIAPEVAGDGIHDVGLVQLQQHVIGQQGSSE